MSFILPTKGSRTHSTATATTTPARIVAANGNRKTITIQNQGSVTVYLGDSAVTGSGATRGYALFAGASFTDNASTQEWWAVAESSTAFMHIVDVR